MDDDGDGVVDEGAAADADEDGQSDEDPLVPRIFAVDATTKTLQELRADRTVVQNLCTHVTSFSASYWNDDAWKTAPQVTVTFVITTDAGKTYTLSGVAYLRNVLERTGKRVL